MHPHPGSIFRKGLFAAAIVAWLGAVGTGFGWLWNYKMTPGQAESVPVTWPADSSIERVPGVPTVVMFAHPLCPCTRASVAELGELLKRAGPVTAHLLLQRPDGVGPEWNDDLLAAAASIPNVRISKDPNGDEARRFRVHTSGHVVVYGGDGALLFSGGVTGARGHMGPNANLDRAIGAVAEREAAPSSCPVYGCCLESHQ